MQGGNTIYRFHNNEIKNSCLISLFYGSFALIEINEFLDLNQFSTLKMKQRMREFQNDVK